MGNHIYLGYFGATQTIGAGDFAYVLTGGTIAPLSGN